MINYFNYSNIIFDFDGVIVNSNKIKKKAIYDASLGLCTTKKHKEFVQYFIDNNGLTREFKIKQFFKDEDFYTILDKYNNLLTQKQKYIELTVGVIDFLKYINSIDNNLYILSGGEEKEIINILNNHSIQYYFQDIKGSPKTKEENLLDLGIRGNTLYIGDSKKDYEIAKEYNFDFIFMYGYTQFEEWRKYFTNKNILLTINNFKSLTSNKKKEDHATNRN